MPHIPNTSLYNSAWLVELFDLASTVVSQQEKIQHVLDILDFDYVSHHSPSKSHFANKDKLNRHRYYDRNK